MANGARNRKRTHPRFRDGGLEVLLGSDAISEPFATWTDASFTVLRQGQRIFAIPPTDAEAIHPYVWTGTDVDDLVPVAPVNGLETGVHRHRGHLFDAGWWVCGL